MPYYFWMEDLLGLILAWLQLLIGMTAGLFFVETLGERRAAETWAELMVALSDTLWFIDLPHAIESAFYDIDEMLWEWMD
ncbi:MAG: hypothetical protein OXG36_10410 [Caldilineaceae bacterium]|nr:hypothetical protein [Caldilineaceae bacterium]